MTFVQDIAVDLCRPSANARPIKPGEVLRLQASIAEIGLRQPINVRPVDSGYEVRGGGHRLAAFKALGRDTIPAFVREDDDLQAELAEIDENLCRNDLSPAERALAIARRKSIYEVLHPETAHGGDRKSSRQVGDLNEAERFTKATAEATGQSERKVQRDAHRGGIGEAALAKVTGTSLDKGEELDALAKLTPERREEIVERAAAGEKVSAKVAVKQERRAGREKELADKIIAAPEGKFGVIVEDYEWDHQTWSEAGKDRHAGNHYPVSTDAHSAEEIVKRTADRFACAADDCVFYMWATIPHLAIAVDVMRLRGFAYKSHHVWVKDSIITGYWSRAQHEVLLIGTKGNVVAPAMGTQESSVIRGPSGEHSEKPEAVMQMIERLWPNTPKLELNSRRSRPGWTVWGLDAQAPIDTHIPLGPACTPASEAEEPAPVSPPQVCTGAGSISSSPFDGIHPSRLTPGTNMVRVDHSHLVPVGFLTPDELVLCATEYDPFEIPEGLRRTPKAAEQVGA